MSALAGRHVVVTRPAEQAGHLCAELADRGAIAVRYPVLAISPVEDVTPLLDRAIALDSYQLVVFVSPNAVEHALSVMLRHRSWPIETTAAGMGRSSEAALARYGVGKIIAPQERFDSESLLAMPPLSDVRGWRILICRGDGGRELLGETLSARGAQVDYLTCYRRSQPTLDPAPLMPGLEEARAIVGRDFPKLAGLRIAQAWGGVIDVTPDVVPVISAVDAHPGFFIATGFSGHGFGIGPGAGRLMADLVAGDRPLVDPHPLRFSRYTDGSRPRPYL